MSKEKNYERVNWQARKTPISAANLNRMDEGIDVNRKAILELQSATYGEDELKNLPIEAEVNTRFELPNVPVDGAYYYVKSTNTIYLATNGTYSIVQSRIKIINGGGA